MLGFGRFSGVPVELSIRVTILRGLAFRVQGISILRVAFKPKMRTREA